MLRTDLFLFYLAFLVSLGLAVVFSRERGRVRSAWQRVLLDGAILVPLAFVVCIASVWSYHMLRVSSGADAIHMYVGVMGRETPYVGYMQDQAPTLYAFHRLVMWATGDASRERLLKTLAWGNAASLGAVCLSVVYYLAWLRGKARVSLLGMVCFLCTVFMGAVLVTRNIEVKNVNIWLAGPVALWLLTEQVSRNNVSHYLGGAALGMAFLVKPCLPVVLIFLLFCGWRDKWTGKMFAALGGATTALLGGFLASLWAPGIGIDTYRQFVFEALPTVYAHPAYHEKMWQANLSLLKYVPVGLVGGTSLAMILGFGALSFAASKRSASTRPWFFVTLLFSPIIWGMHLMAVYPAFLFQVPSREDELRKAIYCALTVTTLFFASVFRAPLIVNLCLLALWSGEVVPRFSR